MTLLKKSPANASRRSAFTLIELLTVIAVIGILAAILIPTVQLVQTNIDRQADRVEYTSVVNALRSYKEKYGYWPPVLRGEGDDVVTPLGEDAATVDLFFIALTGRKADGSPPSTTEEIRQNRNRTSFTELNSLFDRQTDQLMDRSGSSRIFVAIDQDGDGRISADAINEFIPNESDQLPAGESINAPAVMFSVEDLGGSANNDPLWTATFDVN
ncbi:MAG: type II secretion system protein [Opitutales bacterium]